jgi:hypothetical protein
VPDLVGEPMDQWANPQSKTQAWMRDYVREVVTRYHDNPAILAWECGNEFSLAANLPNAAQHRPRIAPKLGTPNTRSEHDELTFDHVRQIFIAFGTEVRKHDPQRLRVTGDSFLRPSAWHQAHGNTWKRDSPEQFAEMLAAVNPDSITGISVHVYKDEDQRLAAAMKVSRAMNKPLFVGEFGAPGRTPEQRAEFTRLLQAILDHHVPLAALWVFDLASQPDYTVTPDNDRSWQLALIAEANRGYKQQSK